MNTRAAGRGTTTAGIAATTDAVTTVAAAGERGRQGTTRGVIYGSPETGVGGLRPVGSADKGGAAEERRLGTEVDSRL